MKRAEGGRRLSDRIRAMCRHVARAGHAPNIGRALVDPGDGGMVATVSSGQGLSSMERACAASAFPPPRGRFDRRRVPADIRHPPDPGGESFRLALGPPKRYESGFNRQS